MFIENSTESVSTYFVHIKRSLINYKIGVLNLNTEVRL
jgi:hypothetical protein